MSSLQVSFKVPARFNYKMKINSNQDIKEFFYKMYDYENGLVEALNKVGSTDAKVKIDYNKARREFDEYHSSDFIININTTIVFNVTADDILNKDAWHKMMAGYRDIIYDVVEQFDSNCEIDKGYDYLFDDNVSLNYFKTLLERYNYTFMCKEKSL